MRRFLILIISILNLSHFFNAASATVSVDVDNLRYTVDTDAKTAEVYGLATAYSSATIKDLVIPDFIEYDDSDIPVISIRDSAFSPNKNLTGSLTIGNNVQTIGNDAFWSCSGFTGSLTIGNSVQTIGNNAFEDCSGFTGSLTIGNSVQTIGNYAFYQCSGFTGSLTIPDNVEEIGNYAFEDCSGFTGSLTIGNSVQTIGNGAFKYCSGFTGSLTIPDNVQTIGLQAFYDCKNFTGELKIPESVKEIGPTCFSSCEKITSLVITSSNTVINYQAFFCRALESITCLGITPPKCVGGSSIFESVFFTTSYNKPLYVPAESITLYKNATEWKKFQYINPISTEATDIKLSKSELELAIGESETLIATLTPEDATTEIVWSVDDAGKDIIAVDQTGKVTALAVGDATVTATAGNVSATCKVTVNPILATTVTISIPDKDVFVGDKITLTASITPENTTDKTLVWTSETPEVATIDAASGELTAVAPGEAKIKVACGNVSATATITVKPILAQSVRLSAEDITLLVGASQKLSATIEPENTTDKSVTWKSDNEAIATVSEDGTVTAISVGTANITATCGEVSATCKVTVNPVLASTVTINLPDKDVFVGDKITLTASITPENTTDKTLVWTSEAPAIATIDAASGELTAVAPGEAKIKVACGDVSATATITVKPILAQSVTLSAEDITLLVGASQKLSATIEPENTTDQSVTWKSDNEAIATVSEDGTVSAVSVGTANITATCGEVTATCKVTVTPVSPSSIELNIRDMVLYIGQSETIQAIVRPPNTTNPTVTWRSEDESIATVSADGKVIGISEGTTTITATCGEVSATCAVTVKPIPASNIEITTGDVTLTIGSTTTLAAKVSPENTTHPDVEWVSSDTDIATIAADGTVTAVSVGTAIITAKCGNVSATCTVTVIPVPSDGIVVTPTSVSMLLGDEVTLKATVYPENTTDKTVTWGSDKPSVASVSSNGVVTALSVGTATITASNGTSKATCEVTVNPVVATGISLNVQDETIFVASTTQLIATISPFNVTDKTITWTSSKPEIATVSDNGLVTGISVGTTTVTATIGSVSASAQINVVHRIPDIDPSVTTSDRDIKTISGKPVNMAVYPVGGEPTGWSYTWTKNGEVVSQSTELNITAINESESVIAETYRVKVENEIDKVVILSEIFDFVVQIYPAVDENLNDVDITISTGNGSSNKTREGNTVALSVTTPAGGYPNGWEYVWSDATGEIGNEETVETIATMSAGSSMATEENTYKLKITNYGPEGDVWAQFNLESNLEVYRRPQTPLQLLRKGDGTSHTFVVMMPLSDSQLEQLNYSFVYGWTDSEGNDHILEQSKLRYCHTEAEIYNNSSNKFWVYSLWNYPDGSVVSSGLCYLDGGIDETFDASVFDGSYVFNEMSTKSGKAVYRIDGLYMGESINNLLPGIYIVISESNGVKSSQKIVIR